MKNLTRREFLKGLAFLAAFALPKPKADEVVPSVQQDVTIFDMLADFNETVMAQADRLSSEPLDSLEILVEPDSYEQFERAFDHVLEYRWSDNIEPEYRKCSACGSPDWTLAAKGLRCTDCGAEDVDLRVAD